MRTLAFVAVAAALLPAAASAQYENRSVSLSGGYLDLNGAGGVEWGVPIGLGYSGYIDSGFEWTVGLDVMLLTERVSEQTVFGLAGGPGLRYLFLQESVRPWIGVDVSYLHVFGTTEASNFVGLGPKVGLDVFLARQFSVGVEGQFNGYLTIKQQVELQTSYGAGLVLAAWF